jgi:hypothetical protein
VIALAISVAFAFSLAVTLGFPGMDLWWELATLVTIMVLGNWWRAETIRGALRFWIHSGTSTSSDGWQSSHGAAGQSCRSAPREAVPTTPPPEFARKYEQGRDRHDDSKPATTGIIDGRHAVLCAVAQPDPTKTLAH